MNLHNVDFALIESKFSAVILRELTQMVADIKTAWSFSIKSLGSLDSGEIQIKPLTLLCGPNNTGKTWVMYSIYWFLNNPEVEGFHGIDSIVSQVKENGVYELDFEEWLTKNIKSAISAIEESTKNILPSVFNGPSEIFDSSVFKWNAELQDILKICKKRKFEFGLNLGSKSPVALRAEKDRDSLLINLTLFRDLPKELLKNAISSLLYSMIQQRSGQAFNSFLIPAERNGLHLFYRELSSRRTALLHHASRDELDLQLLLKDVLGSKYAKPIADYIDWLNDLSSIKKNQKDNGFHDIAEEIRKMVGGKYSVDAEGNISFTPKKKRLGPVIPKMDLHLSSSTVKSLFGLWFYTEYQATDRSVLMIDEPELNLHPSNQRLVARIIAKMVNAGIHVIVSTHSDYFVRELNSLIMLGGSGSDDVRRRLMKEYSIDESSLLDKSKVAAYLFDGGTMLPMEVGREGVIAKTFDEQINILNDSSDDIYYSYVVGEAE